MTQSDPREAALRTLVICDLVDSTGLVDRLGDERSFQFLQQHDRVARGLLGEHDGQEIDKSDGFLLLFSRPTSAVRFALAYHRALSRMGEEEGVDFRARVGIHLGEVFLHRNSPEEVERGAKPLEVEGLAKPMVARLSSLATGRQTLLTRAAFDVARRGAVGTEAGRGRLVWLAQGEYLFKGVEEPVEVFEVGVEGFSPLTSPSDTAKAHRVLDGKVLAGWRPAPGHEILERPNWVVEKKLGEGSAGEVWLASHKKTHDRRAYKFCYEALQLKALKREVTLFRLLKEDLGDRPDISRIFDWNFEKPPYFIETEYSESGTLVDWAEAQGGLAAVPIESRLELMAQTAEALAAAHSVGVLHKDVKPTNILVRSRPDGSPQICLSDFGIGLVTDRGKLVEAGITAIGLTELVADVEGLSGLGTALYMAPELMEGKTASVQADIYALGVVLYQIVVGDFARALAPGWERHVRDDLLREDIAWTLDGNPQRRLGNALRLAERLRNLEDRRRQRQKERQAQREAERARKAAERVLRRRKWVTASMIGLLIFAATMAIQAGRIRREADRANREAQIAWRMSDFLIGLFEASDPNLRDTKSLTVGALLDRSAQRIDEELRDEPEVQATMMSTMGTAYRNLGALDSALPLLEQALANRRLVYGDVHEKVAESLYKIGDLKTLVGDYEGAEEALRESLRMRRALLGDQHLAVAASLHGLATWMWRQQRFEEAEQLALEALDIHRTVLSEGDFELAESLERLGLVRASKGEHQAAEKLFRQSLGIFRDLTTEHPSVAALLANLSIVLWYQGRVDEVEPLLSEATEIYARLVGEQDHRVALILLLRARVLHYRGDSEAAEALCREALEMMARRVGDNHPVLADFRTDLAGILVARGRYAEGRAEAERTLAALRQRQPPTTWSIAMTEAVVGASLVGLGQCEQARPLLLASHPVVRDHYGEQSPNHQAVLGYLAELQTACGGPERLE